MRKNRKLRLLVIEILNGKIPQATAVFFLTSNSLWDSIYRWLVANLGEEYTFVIEKIKASKGGRLRIQGETSVKWYRLP